MNISKEKLQQIIEGALLAYGQPMTMAKMQALFVEEDEADRPGKEEIQAALEDIQADCKKKGYELKEISSGYRFQVKQEIAPWINQLWEEKPQKYSRALMETLALIAYRQPITRGDIEEIRGVAVSSTIIRTLIEREWVRIVGHRDVPGRPALYATTKQFLDYFNLKNLEDLPPLGEINDLDDLNEELEFNEEQTATEDVTDAVTHELEPNSHGVITSIEEADVDDVDVSEADVIETDVIETSTSEQPVVEDAIAAEGDTIDDNENDEDIARLSFADIVQNQFSTEADGELAELPELAESADEEDSAVQSNP